MAPMTDDELAEIEAEFCPAPGVVREPSHGVPDLVAEVRRLTAALATVTAEHAAALDAARREGAEEMRAAAVRLLDACGGPRSKLAIEDAIHAVNHAALPLDAPGGAS